jgi:hypothetical protein
MGVASFPASGGGGLSSVVKSLQTGTASSAGTITITAVNTAKAFVYATSTGSAGTVAASGTVNAAYGSTSGISFSAFYGNLYGQDSVSTNWANLGNGAAGATLYFYSNINGGSSSTQASGIIGNQWGAGGYITAYSVGRYYIPAYSAGTGVYAYDSSISVYGNAMNTNGANVSMNSTSLTGRTTSGLYAAQYGAVLTNSTTLTVTGPCTYQVIEYY